MVFERCLQVFQVLNAEADAVEGLLGCRNVPALQTFNGGVLFSFVDPTPKHVFWQDGFQVVEEEVSELVNIHLISDFYGVAVSELKSNVEEIRVLVGVGVFFQVQENLLQLQQQVLLRLLIPRLPLGSQQLSAKELVMEELLEEGVGIAGVIAINHADVPQSLGLIIFFSDFEPVLLFPLFLPQFLMEE